MTREDEIYKAANKFSKEMITPFPATINLGFIKGAMWADEHPKTIKMKDVDLVEELGNYIKHYRNRETGYTMLGVARHFFELGLRTKEECIKSIPLHGWQTPCADPNYPCENPQMDCINCPRFGHPQGTITMTSMKEKESEQGLVGKETFTTGSWSEIKEDK